MIAAKTFPHLFGVADIVHIVDKSGIIYRDTVVLRLHYNDISAATEYTVQTVDGERTFPERQLQAVLRQTDVVLPFQPKPIEGHVQGSTNGVLTSIHAGNKVWTIRALAEAVIRKMMPVGTVAKHYFPLARRGEAAVAWLGNEKHNPGQELHWAEGKSNDHLDCAGRHLTESDDWDVTVLPDGRTFAVLHAAQLAWRASALAELAARKYGGVVIVQLENPSKGKRARIAAERGPKRRLPRHRPNADKAPWPTARSPW